MGKLIYGSAGSHFDCDDRTLAHLRFVMTLKLRRNESFSFTWDHGVENGGGRSTVWLHPAIELHFEFSGSKEPTLNRSWLELLSNTANGNRGLSVVLEPPESPER